jgi:UDP-N-acetylglucosamine 2-epimerase
MRDEIDVLFDEPGEYERRAKPSFPYGNGAAAVKIVDEVEGFERR